MNREEGICSEPPDVSSDVNACDGGGISRRDFLLAGAAATAGGYFGVDSAEAARPAPGKSDSTRAAGSHKSMLVKNATVLVTMDGARREIADGGLYIEDGVIKQVGPTRELPKTAAEVLDLRGHIVLPGLINVHHHLYQHLTRVVPACQDGNVFNWLKVLYPMWARMTPEAMQASILVGLSELALSGCTTAFDHQYIFPNGCRLDHEIEAARQFGMRLHASRGSMSLGVSKGGLPPDSCVENEDAILKDCQRVIEAFHDPKPQSMARIVLAPCSPFSVTDALMVESAKMARHYKVNLHTHLAESLDEERYTMGKYNLRPVGLMEKFEWVGNDVWFAHSVHINEQEIGVYSRTGCGVAHCPSSNMRLASGIAPIKQCRDAGVKVGLGVDGSSSNDSSHLLAEARMAMLLARTLLSQTAGGPPAEKSKWLSARDALEMATLGGAAILGRNDIGSLEPGKSADFFSVKLNDIAFAGGSMVDPVAAVVFCSPRNADYTVINGRAVVKEGRIISIDLPVVMEKCNKLAMKIVTA